MPQSRETHIHRVGRTGRAGAHGEAILVLAEIEAGFLTKLEGINIVEDTSWTLGANADTHTDSHTDLRKTSHSSLWNKSELDDEDQNDIEMRLTLLQDIIRNEINMVSSKNGAENKQRNTCSVRSSHQRMTNLIKNAYRSMLGYYSGRLRRIPLASTPGGQETTPMRKRDWDLQQVEFMNSFVFQTGMTNLPEIGYSAAVNLRLDSTIVSSRLNIVSDDYDDKHDDDHDHGYSKGGHRDRKQQNYKHHHRQRNQRKGPRKSKRKSNREDATDTIFNDGGYENW